jgi:hypothetical protein
VAEAQTHRAHHVSSFFAIHNSLAWEGIVSLAWYIQLERNIPGFEAFVNGKAAAKAAELLDSLAKDAGVTPLSDFFGASAENLAEFAEDHGVDLKEMGAIPDEQWFSPEDGLKTLRALMQAAETQKLSNQILEDLKEFQKVLEAAAANGIRWHLAVDF